MENTSQFRNLINSSDSVAFGCSHTWGVGVDANETWSYYLDAMNFGINGCSADFVVRLAFDIIGQISTDHSICIMARLVQI